MLCIFMFFDIILLIFCSWRRILESLLCFYFFFFWLLLMLVVDIVETTTKRKNFSISLDLFYSYSHRMFFFLVLNFASESLFAIPRQILREKKNRLFYSAYFNILRVAENKIGFCFLSPATERKTFFCYLHDLNKSTRFVFYRRI